MSEILRTASQLARSPKFGGVELTKLPEAERKQLVDDVAAKLHLDAHVVQSALVSTWARANERGAGAVAKGAVAESGTKAPSTTKSENHALAFFANKNGPLGAAKLPGADILSAGELKALNALAAVKPKTPAPLFLLTDPNKDPDDLSVMIHTKHLIDAGFVDLKGVVTTLGDRDVRTQRAQFAASVLDQLGIKTRVGVGVDYAIDTDAKKKDHAKFTPTSLVSPGVAVEQDGQSVLVDGLKNVADKSAVLLVNAGMADAAALLRDQPELAQEKIKKLVVMGGVNPGVDENGRVAADSRAYNNTTHQASADFVYRRAQELGIELVVVSKEAAYAAAAPRSFYDGAAKTGHDVGVSLKDQQQSALAHLWDGINAGHMPPALNPAWFFKTFTDVNPDTPDGAATIAKAVANKGDFDAIWNQVTKFNLYDPLALLAAAPGASDLLYQGGAVGNAKSSVRVIGAGEVKDSALAKDLMSAMAVVSLASSPPKGAVALAEQLELGRVMPSKLADAHARFVARFGEPRPPGIEMVAFEKGAVFRERGGATWRPVPSPIPRGTSLTAPPASYQPVHYESQSVLKEAAKADRGEKTWAHKTEMTRAELDAKVAQMSSHLGPIVVDDDGHPLNPMGPTGVSGRGESNEGPIKAQDLFAWSRGPDGKKYAIVITRSDTGRLAMPGGIEDAKDQGAKVPTAVREFFEETAATHKDKGVDVEAELLKAFANAKQVYRGGCPKEPRNTDNMWFETTVFSVELPWKLASGLVLNGSDDATKAELKEVTPDLIAGMHGDHPDFVKLALSA